jgi:acetyl-CoA carboxylase carboxyl transferase subunit beta
MNWLTKSPTRPTGRRPAAERRAAADAVWTACEGCRATLYAAELAGNLQVCPRCAHHGRIRARARLAALLDTGSAADIGAPVVSHDALQFHDTARYAARLAQARESAAEADALVIQTGRLHGLRVTVACFEYAFMGGSMGSAVGERFVRAVDAACAGRMPFVCITASGGARIQEGLFSLLQMGKTASAVADLRRARMPFVSILTNPTMGGVSASFAFLADVVIAEPGALIGFAGPRVIEQTIRAALPPGFQRAELLQRKGALDLIVPRPQQRAMLQRILSMLLPATT